MNRTHLLHIIFVVLALAVATPTVFAQSNQTNRADTAFGVFVPAVERNNKDQVALLYRDYFYAPGLFDTHGELVLTPTPITADWTGNIADCNAGTTNPAFRQGAIRQINYFRAMAGLSTARIASNRDTSLAQAAALITGANATLTHTPAPTSKCYSADGALGAGSSNLGFSLARIPTLNKVASYFDDAGDNNRSVGHRTNLLYPAAYSFGYGTTEFTHPAVPTFISHADSVYGSNVDFSGLGRAIEVAKPEFVSWPSAGYFPQLALPVASNRWSVSCSTCDFTNAKVTFKKDGLVQPESDYDSNGRDANFDPTIVFRPKNVDYGWVYYPNTNVTDRLTAIKQESTYDVTITNVTVRPGCEILKWPERKCPDTFPTVIKSFNYSVTVFDVQKHLASKVFPKYNVTDLWWNAAESGWGISITQGRTGQLFGTWFTYDRAGKPNWYVMPGCVWLDEVTCRGSVYTTTGTAYAATYRPADNSATLAGTMTLKFNSDKSAVMETIVDGVTNTKTITRQPFGDGNYADGKNYSGLWNRDPIETGWGISINQQFNTIFAAAYIYGADGKPTWFVLPGGVWTQDGTKDIYEGDIYTTTGPAFDRPFDVNAVKANLAGRGKITFKNDYQATLTYTLNGVTVSKDISRFQF
jgi:hypothetical protein